MPRYVAFLRAINVGGHVVTMERLRALFEEVGCTKVGTFIASGNVIFESKSTNPESLASKVERHLERALGYEVATCLRTEPQVAAIAAGSPFTARELESAQAHNVAFLRRAAPKNADRLLDAVRTEHDEFRVVGDEVYWLCQLKQSYSKFSGAKFERLLGTPATWRGLKMLQRLAAKSPPAGAR